MPPQEPSPEAGGGGFLTNLAKINWKAFWESGVAVLGERVDVFKQLSSILGEEGAPRVFMLIMEAFILGLGEIGKKLGEVIDDVERTAGPVLQEAAAAGLSDLFDTPISPAEVFLQGGKGQRAGLADKLGGIMLERMISTFDTGGNLTPEFGQANAERFVGFSLKLALEGWLTGIFTKTALTRFLPNWGDLDDIVASNLGLQNTASTVLRPIIQALVLTPFNWQVNKTFTPRIFGDIDAVRAWILEEIGEDEYFETMARLGWTREKAASMKILKGRFPFKEDIARMQRFGMLDREQAEFMLRRRGFLPEMATLLAEMQERIPQDRVSTALLQVGRSMFREKEIEETDYRRILENANLPAEIIDGWVGVGLLERSRPARIPRAAMERAFTKRFIEEADLIRYYREEGFTTEQVQILMQLAEDKRASEDDRLRRAEEAERARRLKLLN